MRCLSFAPCLAFLRVSVPEPRMTGRPAATLLHVGPGLANGLANLHNAKRAYSPLVNIAGDYPSYHSPHDPLLSADLEGLASVMSAWVRRASSPATLG